MLVYESIKSDFMDCVLNDVIVDKINEKYKSFFGNANESEKRAWRNSMEYMYKVLSTDTIPKNSGVAIEFNIPYTSKRVDFIISGKNERADEAAVIIELKQWEKLEAVRGKDGIVKTFIGGANREVTHPSCQAWSYTSVIEDFNEIVQKEHIGLYPCAYLHNYIKGKNDPIEDSIYSYYTDKAPVYTRGEVVKLREFIQRFIKYGDNKEVLYKIENGRLKPSKSLQDCISNMLEGNLEFVLIDEQKVVYEQAMEMAKQSKRDNKKRVLIVEGGPGTGKTVLAINLLADLTNEDMVAQYVTKNAAPRNVFLQKLKGKSRNISVNNLFKSSGSYTTTPKNYLDVLIVDEAHRLNEKSGLFQNLGENQIKEIINASKFSVFFIDEDQRIHIKDIGEVAEIKKHAKKYKNEIIEMKLESQFRCNGSNGYLAWLDHALQIRETANFDGFDGEYEIKIYDNPSELREFIYEKNIINNKARLVAGYCWNWITESKNNPDVYDIEIPEYDFRMSWNLGDSDTWAIDSESVNQVGCIHTSQGLEFDYVGVIIGKDMRYENGKIVTDFNERAKTDRSLWGIKTMHKKNPEKALEVADRIIKNTYRTLMTRGQKGCYIYCEDKGLSDYLKEVIYKKFEY